MIITRKFGRILRGNATPFQLFLACFLAGLIGFMPGFSQAPGLLVLFTILLIVFNANLALAAMVGLAAKLLSLALMPVSFSLGRTLLDGPTQGWFKSMINAPVLALFGFEYYATTGGLLLGLAFGLLTGVLTVKLINGFRRKMVDLEKNSERFQQFMSKGWVKAFVFVFVSGSKGKLTYEELLERQVGNPIRPLGAVFVVLLAVLVIVIQLFASGPIVVMALQSGLEKANGATVDISGADLSLKNNRLMISGLAMADPKALDTDLFRAERIEADISASDLLRKRLQIERMVVTEGRHGGKRSSAGRLIGPVKPAPPETKPTGDAKSIEDYIQNAKVWKERLSQVRDWMEKISKDSDGGSGRGGSGDPSQPGQKQETLQERLERLVREKGYANVTADHLIESSPTLTIRELIAEKMKVSQLPNETVDLTARNMSTHPRLLAEPPRVTIKSSGETISLEAILGGASPIIDLNFRHLQTDHVTQNLILGGTRPVQGGTMDISAKGTWKSAGGVSVDFPLQVTLHDSTIQVANSAATKVKQMVVPIGVTGSLDNPHIRFDAKQFAEAAVRAGAAQAVSTLQNKAQEKIGQELQKKLGDQGKDLNLEKGKQLLDGFLGGKKKPE